MSLSFDQERQSYIKLQKIKIVVATSYFPSSLTTTFLTFPVAKHAYVTSLPFEFVYGTFSPLFLHLARYSRSWNLSLISLSSPLLTGSSLTISNSFFLLCSFSASFLQHSHIFSCLISSHFFSLTQSLASAITLHKPIVPSHIREHVLLSKINIV